MRDKDEEDRERKLERKRKRGSLHLLSVWFPWLHPNLVKKVDIFGVERKMVCVCLLAKVGGCLDVCPCVCVCLCATITHGLNWG